jgi:hypothetical protein
MGLNEAVVPSDFQILMRRGIRSVTFVVRAARPLTRSVTVVRHEELARSLS